MEHTSTPKITFGVSGKEIPESPKLSAIVLQQMIRQLGLEEIVIELEMEKHHGVSVYDIIFFKNFKSCRTLYNKGLNKFY